MARTVDRGLRDRLLDAVTADLVRQGLAGASLNRLAAAAGTSARMLVHHFGSREALLDLALERARARQLAAVTIALPAEADFVERLGRAWSWFSDPDVRGAFRLSSEVAAIERTAGATATRATMAGEWLALLRAGFRAAGYPASPAETLATIVAAQLRGLFLDLDATGDDRRVGRAYRRFVRLLPSP